MNLPVTLDPELRRHVIVALKLYRDECRRQLVACHPALVSLTQWLTDSDRQETTTLPGGMDLRDGGPMLLLLTYAQTAEAFGVDKRTVERLVAAGELPVIYVSPGAPRIHRDDLDAFIERQRVREEIPA